MRDMSSSCTHAPAPAGRVLAMSITDRGNWRSGSGRKGGRPPGSRPEIGQGQRQGGRKIKWATKGGQHQIEGHPITH